MMKCNRQFALGIVLIAAAAAPSIASAQFRSDYSLRQTVDEDRIYDFEVWAAQEVVTWKLRIDERFSFLFSTYESAVAFLMESFGEDYRSELWRLERTTRPGVFVLVHTYGTRAEAESVARFLERFDLYTEIRPVFLQFLPSFRVQP